MVNFAFKTKTNETFTLEAAAFSYHLSTESGEKGPHWVFSGSVQLERSIDPFLYKIASKMINTENEPTGLEIKIVYPRVENEMVHKYEILLKNVRITNSFAENLSFFDNPDTAHIGATFEITSAEAVIYGVDFSAR
jgi:hypothetical protein